MPHSSNKNGKKSSSNKNVPAPTPSPITRPPIYSPPTLWDSVKTGFGMSMGSRMFGFIFGDPIVKVEHKNQPPPTSVYKEQNNCDTLREQIKFYQCDKETCDDKEKCDDLLRQFYKCQKNM